MTYSDVDYGTCLDIRRSVSGVILTLNGGPLNNLVFAQTRSRCNINNITVYDATKEIVWTRGILEELGLCQLRPTVLYCDNTTA